MGGEVYIGTSGWSYKHWVEVFYPVNLQPAEWLGYYSGFFNSVEINSSFYHLVSEKTYKKWYEVTPSDFRFSVKASRFITHVKKLRDIEEALDRFFGGVRYLREKLSIVLFQFPPSLRYDKGRINDFMEVLSAKGIFYMSRVCFEVRNRSFCEEEFYQLLKDNNIALCFSDWPGVEISEPVTADFVYLRRHGPKSLYTSNYSDEELRKDSEFVVDCIKKNIDVYLYFNNDAYGYAVECGRKVLDFVKRASSLF